MNTPYENNFHNNQNDGSQHTEPEKNTQPSGTSPVAPGYGTASAPYTSQTSGQAHSAGTQGVPVGSPYTPHPGGYPSAQNRSAYTWTPQNSAPQGTPYYSVPPQAPKKKEKKPGRRLGLKIAAAVLACGVVSFGSVGAFALMIQNGVVDVKSAGGGNQTAAFTIYKKEDTGEATPTVTGTDMTPQEVAQKVIPSVVCVQNYQIRQPNGFFYGGMGYDQQSASSEISPAGEGSGIIISKDGYIVTNQHVIDSATSIKVVTSEGLTYEAELIGEDTQSDLAVIKVTTEDEFTPAEFGSSQDLQVADEVMAIGNPGGLQLNSSVTMGYVSALNRRITNGDTGYSMSCIQTDAAINPGNSGGALVDMDGHVVGVNSSKIAATEYEGLGFAIPSDTVQPIVSDLIEYGYVKDRPMLGVSGQFIDGLTASFYGLTQGYYVEKTLSAEAEKSGLQRGDVITAIDNTQVTSATTISSYISNKKPGDTVTLTVNRAMTGESGLAIEVVLTENTGESN